MIVDCEQCGKSHALMCERTNKRNYSVQRIRLCRRCRDRLGISALAPAYSGSSRSKYSAPSV